MTVAPSLLRQCASLCAAFFAINATGVDVDRCSCLPHQGMPLHDRNAAMSCLKSDRIVYQTRRDSVGQPVPGAPSVAMRIDEWTAAPTTLLHETLRWAPKLVAHALFRLRADAAGRPFYAYYDGNGVVHGSAASTLSQLEEHHDLRVLLGKPLDTGYSQTSFRSSNTSISSRQTTHPPGLVLGHLVG